MKKAHVANRWSSPSRPSACLQDQRETDFELLFLPYSNILHMIYNLKFLKGGGNIGDYIGDYCGGY